MDLECVVVHDSCDHPEMYREVFAGEFPGFCNMQRVSHYLKNHKGLMPGLQEDHCDIYCHVITAGLVVMV